MNLEHSPSGPAARRRRNDPRQAWKCDPNAGLEQDAEMPCFDVGGHRGTCYFLVTSVMQPCLGV